MTTKKNILISRGANTTQTANDSSANPHISADGRYVFFESRATDIVLDG
jgi:Tol biopolymer transport system component